MPTTKRKSNDEPAVTVYKRVNRVPARRPLAKHYPVQSGAIGSIREENIVIPSVEGYHRDQRSGLDYYLHIRGNQSQRESMRQATLMCYDSEFDMEEDDISTNTDEYAPDELARD